MILRTTVWEALDLLPPRRRAAIAMSEVEESQISSIASLAGITSITVRRHLSRGMRELLA
jgi:DNA-directed RNA polymerase specialized sigma24 family protein